MSQSEPIGTPIGDPQQTPNKNWYQDMLQSARGGDDKRVFTLNFRQIYYPCYSNPFNTNEYDCLSYDSDRFKKIKTFDKELADKIRKYVSFHKINLPDDYKKLSEWDCRKLSLLSLDKYVISGVDTKETKEVVVNDELKQKLLGNYGRYDFWSNWTNKNARADVTDVNDKTTMNGPVRIDFHFDFSKLKSLVSPGGTGGTRRNRRRRIVSRRLKKSHRSVGTRKNRRVYRK